MTSASVKRLSLPSSIGALVLGVAGLLASAKPAAALEVDWSGQFRSEFHYISHYTLTGDDNGALPDSTRQAAGGYYITPGGSNNATFETLFLRLRPKIVVNDNIYIKSEFWVGDPVYGLFGNAYPFSSDQRQFYSTQSRGSVISAQRFWGEFLSDFGTVQVGRAPLNWGLGVFWNAGDGLYDRYMSTGDVIRLISKFGSFTFSPAFVNYSTGNTVGGACAVAAGTCSPAKGSGVVSDYSLMLKYENLEEEFEGGVNFVRRIAGGDQDTSGVLSPQNPTTGGLAFNTWDLYMKKKLGRLNLGIEAPITSGTVSGVDYSTVAVAAEADWKPSDSWGTNVKIGYAPGQPNDAPTSSGGLSRYKAYYFNPNYKLGNILFNYQLNNLGRLNTLNNPNASAANLASPFDAPIVNAFYVGASEAFTTDKWTFNSGLIYAQALKTAKNGEYFYNHWTHQLVGPANGDQGKSLGVEWDVGAAFQWDEYFNFRLDLGLLFPGSFYKFSNVAGVDNQTSTVFSSAFRVGVNF